MSKGKAKKLIKYWKDLKPMIGKGAEEEIKRIERKYNKQRGKQSYCQRLTKGD